MKVLSSSLQRLLKVTHLLVAGLWLSCVIVLTLMPLIARNITNGDELYMYNYIFYFIDMFVLTPAAVLTLVTGLLYSLFTKWGFFKHGWIIYKWLVTLAIVLIGTFYLGPTVEKVLAVVDTERIMALQNHSYLHGSAVGLWAGVVNSSLLIVAVVVSVYKPWKHLKS